MIDKSKLDTNHYMKIASASNEVENTLPFLVVWQETVVLDGESYECYIVRHFSATTAQPIWFCGYVTVPENSNFFGQFYDDVAAGITTGVELTYSNAGRFGFDTLHVGMENVVLADVIAWTNALARDLHEQEEGFYAPNDA